MSPEGVVALIGINALAWAAMQLGLAWVFTRMPAVWFSRGAAFAWESDGRFYERLTGVKRWKEWLPDGAAWFAGGVPKRSLPGRGAPILHAFAREISRGEATHWAAILVTPVFLLWNPPWVMPLHLAYAVAANLPCIVAQRYNRARLLRLLARAEAGKIQ